MIKRLERAGADRYIGEDVAHCEVDRRQRGRQHAVHRARAGRAGAGKVEAQRVADLLDRQRNGERPVDHPVGIDDCRRSPGAVRHARNMRPHLFRGTPPEFGDGLDDGCVAVAVEDLEEARLADMQCCGLRLDIADALVRHPDVGGDDRVDFRVERASLEEFDRRQPEALLFHRRGRRGKAARHRAAYVGPVAGIRQPAEDPPLPVDRHGEAHVHQMRAAEIWIVDDIDVAVLRLQAAACGDHLDDGPCRMLHDPDEYGQAFAALGDKRAVEGRIDAVRTIVGLRDDRREGCPREGQVHLVAGLLECGLNDRKRDGVEAHDGHAGGRCPVRKSILIAHPPR